MMQSLRLRAVAGALVLGAAAASHAEICTLGNSGWNIESTSTDRFTLQAVKLAETPDIVVFKLIGGWDDLAQSDGEIQPLDLNFIQTKSSAASRLVINSTVLSNRTSIDWIGFRMTIVDPGLDVAAQAHFNPVITGPFNGATSQLPTGFHIEPFSNGIYSPLFVENQDLLLQGGSLPSGKDWHPGDGGSRGQLVIQTSPQANGGNNSFHLLLQPQTNVVPEPASWMAVGLLLLSRRLRRA